jgi:hypothetical protein
MLLLRSANAALSAKVDSLEGIVTALQNTCDHFRARLEALEGQSPTGSGGTKESENHFGTPFVAAFGVDLELEGPIQRIATIDID